ncbi:hypothetical protein [Mucilaginibacter sp. SP1R1]|uniref:hypothetical protein n=1 Tax=Mucilaginibacter sp. SP1R1 TaxID=2723091 RepID=UPI0016173DAB|nr:hypothetical protein [Mucilaginibacter sp. SP1R1]MBB6150166.1 hypothetical protein [Mucilaginibacter sp. SP1R1]
MSKKEADIINDDPVANMSVVEVESYISAMEKSALLYEERNFDERIEAIDFIEFQLIGQIEYLLQKDHQSAGLLSLKGRADNVKCVLEAVDISLFKQLRENIRTGGQRGTQFKSLVKKYVGFNLEDNEHQGEPGYDNLDIFINGLFPFPFMPEQTKNLEPGMVYYQKTPARIVFELVEKSQFNKDDVFFDLGSGLGQVAILVNLLAGIRTRGVEFEPAFCNYANDCAAELNITNVAFINADARQTYYSEGTIFFMYTPFTGQILQDVLEILRAESLHRKIKIITYGPCTAQVALQSWLHFAAPQDTHIYKLGFFTSL